MHLAVESGFQLPIPVFVSVTWILILIVSGRDSEFLELYRGFQSPRFRIPRSKILRIPESVFPYMGLVDSVRRCYLNLFITN